LDSRLSDLLSKMLKSSAFNSLYWIRLRIHAYNSIQ